MNFHGLMAMRLEIARIEIRDTEQARITSRHLLGIAGLVQAGLAQIHLGKKFGIVRTYYQDTHSAAYPITNWLRRTKPGNCRHGILRLDGLKPARVKSL